MITISLNQIRKHSPCEDGWKKLLTSKGGTSADMEQFFPLTDVLDSNGLDDALWCLRCLPEHDRLWRKYAVWCARQVQYLMTDERSLNALDVAWRHSEGLATDEDLSAARTAARDAAWTADAAAAAAWTAAAARTANAARSAAWTAAWPVLARTAARAAAWAAAGDSDAAKDAAKDAARDAQKTKLSEILTAGIWVDSATAREEHSCKS